MKTWRLSKRMRHNKGNAGGEYWADEVAQLEDEVAQLEQMVVDAYEACCSEYMNCPWCAGMVANNKDEWHDKFCDWTKLSVAARDES